ncbi:unnamed protein product [Nippostrongylus brasiliensis]|uniref:C2H2-type domain-containing protein n=1 Tax=Nippostrongylus brasiliensis TaxID=27835 RepID=A0A0N4YAT3_NIPBR|nr:unnamed protein product [Nippostrongylus brasiliensis]
MRNGEPDPIRDLCGCVSDTANLNVWVEMLNAVELAKTKHVWLVNDFCRNRDVHCECATVHDRAKAIESDHCTTDFVARVHHGMDYEMNSHAEENDNGNDSHRDGFDVHDDLCRECYVWSCFAMRSHRGSHDAILRKCDTQIDGKNE